MHRSPWIRRVLSLVAVVSAVSPLELSPEVVRVVVDRREVLLGGRAWGEHGAYEKLVGRVFFEFDPAAPANARIVDLEYAPTNGDGRVEAWAEFMVLQPVEPGNRRGVAWLEVSNRGGKASLRYFNRATARGWDPTTESQLGDGLLMRQGLTLIWVGWQWDVPDGEGVLKLHAPTARTGGGPLRGLVRADWVVDAPTDTLALGHRGHRAYVPADPADVRNVLTVRDGRNAPRTVVPREGWRYTASEDGRITAITRDGGFEAGKIYELVYPSEDPRVVGLGLAAVRDMMSYSRYDLDSEFPTRSGIAFGVSQTGRFLRHFLYDGFNVDEDGRTVFDGMLIHTAGAGRGSFNHRFGQPSRDAHRYSAFFYPTDVFPFASRTLTDPVTGVQEGLLDRTPEADRPRVFYTNTGYEYWGRAASLVHTSPDGTGDVFPLGNERIYHLAGGQHFVGRFPPSAERPPAPPRSPDDPDGLTGPPAYGTNPLDFLLTLRALAVRLVQWVDEDSEPPASAFPTLGAGTLAPVPGVAFPAIPGIETPAVAHEAYRVDYGPRFRSDGIVTVQPPTLGPPFGIRVPQVDGLGNELGGLQAVELRAPLGTYYPWSLRGPDAPGSPHELSDFTGTFVPLPRTEEERRRWGDPRPSLEGLYSDREQYMRRVVAAVQILVSEGLLLPEDAGAASARAAEMWDWLTRGDPTPTSGTGS